MEKQILKLFQFLHQQQQGFYEQKNTSRVTKQSNSIPSRKEGWHLFRSAHSLTDMFCINFKKSNRTTNSGMDAVGIDYNDDGFI